MKDDEESAMAESCIELDNNQGLVHTLFTRSLCIQTIIYYYNTRILFASVDMEGVWYVTMKDDEESNVKV